MKFKRIIVQIVWLLIAYLRCQLSIDNYQLTIINYQLSIINYQLSIDSMIGVYINPFTVFGFKRIFGGEDNKHLLIDFLNELLWP